MDFISNFFKLIILLFLCIYHLGCQSGIVTVQNIDQEKKPLLKSPTAGDPAAEKQGATSSETSSVDSTVYFVTLLSNMNQIPTIIGIDFLSSNATITHPFGIRLNTARTFAEFAWNPILIEGTGHISWIELPSTSKMAHLKILDPRTLQIFDRGEIFNAVNWSISSNAEWVAGIQSDGKALLQNIPSGTISPLLEKTLSKDSDTFQLSTQKQVAILDSSAHRVDLFSLAEPGKVIKSWKTNIFSISPLGTYFIIVDNKGTQIIETSSGNAIQVTGDLSNLRFPQWKNEEALAFISGPLNHPQLQILDLKTAIAHVITSLSANSKEEILVCPAWIKNDLFYADRIADNTWKIWRIEDPISKNSMPKLFAQPQDSGKGYVCPKGITE